VLPTEWAEFEPYGGNLILISSLKVRCQSRVLFWLILQTVLMIINYMSYPKLSFLLISFLAYFPIHLMAQPLAPGDNGLKEYTIKDPSLGLIRFYTDTEKLQKRMPLFIEVNGSGGLPLCIYIRGKGFSTLSNTFNTQLKDEVTKRHFRYIILGKPGTSFCDTITTNDDIRHFDQHTLISNYKFSAEYNRRLSLDWRISATKKVITYLIGHGFWDNTKIVAYGYSEGAQVVPALAVADKRISHIVTIAGSGLNQFYDGIIAWRIKAAKGELTQQQAQDSIDAELKQIKDIYLQPGNTQLQYSGHSYKRWASFGHVPPFEELRKLNIPIYMIAGTADENSPVYGLDYVQLDFIRLGKNNLTYEPCVGCDHYLNSTQHGKTVNHTAEYFEKIFRWLAK